MQALYVDGQVDVAGSNSELLKISPDQVGIGARFMQGSPDRFYAGAMDEVRISSVARSADWLLAEYLTVASNTPTFTSYGHVTKLPGRGFAVLVQ